MEIADNAAQLTNATTISLGMYKLDPVILDPQVKNNREAHEYYLKHTMEQAAIVKLIQELLGYVRDTFPDIQKPRVNHSTKIPQTPSSNEMTKVEVQSWNVKSSLNKRNSNSKNVCKEHVKHPVKGAKALCSTSFIVFIDDILIYSNSKEDHEVLLKLVLELLKKEKFFAKLSKYEFWLQEVRFRRHVFNSNDIRMDSSKIEATKN
nr:putative reverse transcriptase domain-containing protein [Tanacetum cinerariifolium]